MDCSIPFCPVHHQLPELAQTHVHWVSNAIQPSHPLSSPSPPAFNPSQHQGLFQWVSSSLSPNKNLWKALSAPTRVGWVENRRCPASLHLVSWWDLRREQPRVGTDGHSSPEDSCASHTKPTNDKCWRGWGGEGTLFYSWWECKLIQPLCRTLWSFLEMKWSERHSVVSDSSWPPVYSPWNSPGQNTGVSSSSLLRGIFLTQGSNPSLPHCRQTLYQLSHKRSPGGSLRNWK